MVETRPTAIIVIAVCVSVLATQANVLTVPTFYPNITAAIDSSSSGDTILLQPGDYDEIMNVSHNLTIASQWLFNNDTLTAIQTSIRPPAARLITVNSCTLRIAGILFRAGTPRTDSMQLIRGSNVMLQLDQCRFDGVFTTARFFSTALIYLSGVNSQILANDCRVFNDSIAATPVMFCRDITLHRCVFLGRTNSTAYNELMPAIRCRNNLRISDSYFDIRGEGISEVNCFVERSRFVRSGSMAFSFGGQSINRFDYCQFDSMEMIESAAVFRFSNPTEFVGCTFSNAFGNGVGPILSANEKFEIDSCVFSNNQGFSRVFSTNRFVMNFSRIIDNTTDFLWKYDLSYDSIFIANCDFIRTTRLVGGSYNFSNLPAPNCYWGDSTGPNHPLNPGGLGMALPGYSNPFPFLTTPIFPDVAAPEPITQEGAQLPQPFQFSMYPNPTNGTATIRFSLPPPSPVTGVLYDRTGRQVSTFALPEANRRNGVYPISLVNTPSGMYFIRLATPQTSATQSILLVK